MAKYKQITQLLGQRIAHSDYVLQDFPTDRDLAQEVGASKVTVRKAVQHLIDEGLLTRQPNGRPTIKRDGHTGKRSLHIALLTVAYPSPVLERWHQVIGPLVSERDWMVRTVGFTHFADPVIQQTLDNFDGIFVVPAAEDPPEHLINPLRASRHPVIVLGEDWSSWGVRSLLLTSPAGVQVLLHHLRQNGHKQVMCLNTEPGQKIIRQRIEQWQLWAVAYGQPAELIDRPVASFESSIWQAYQVMNERLHAGALEASAIYCTSAGAARGAMRALHEHGLTIGKDISLCAAIDHGGTAPLWTPSLTSLTEPDAKPYVSVCLDWMAQGGRDWQGPMLVEPRETPLFQGESTGAVSVTQAVSCV